MAVSHRLFADLNLPGFLIEEDANQFNGQLPFSLRLSGDLRLRYQSEKKSSDIESRDRTRFRLRLRSEAAVNDKTTVYFGIASGGADARSNNQTFGEGHNAFEFYSLAISQAYIQTQWNDNVTVLAGKMTRPFWTPSNMLWDSDINPDGVAAKWTNQIPFTEFFVNGGYFVMDELNSLSGSGSSQTSDNEAGMVLVQPGLTYTINRYAQLKSSISYYNIRNTIGNTINNGTDSTGELKIAYDPIVISTELKLENRSGQYGARVYAELLKNTALKTNSKAAVFGFAFGTPKVVQEGDWQVLASYRYIQENSWLSIFPDSDYYGGDVGVKGLRLGYQYGLANQTSFTLSWVATEKISVPHVPMSLVQADLQVNF